jgi:aspartokinase/homoserine dehydrogenase 1
MPADRSSTHPAIFLVGTGVVGGALLGILRSEERPRGVWLAGVANRRGALLGDTSAIGEARIAELLARPSTEPPKAIDDDLLDRLAGRQQPVLVDVTAADAMEDLYARALERGIHVVTANKKPLVCAWPKRERLFDLARETGTKLRYEATVGAGLPVIETAKDLVRTGDRVRRIDCVLSGTLGFLSNELARGTPLSRAASVAKDRGYTEPDPREDLGGADVARKAVILAREIGARCEVSDVELEPFVPADVLASSSAATITKDLVRLDDAFAKRIEGLRRRGEKLVYLARIEVDASGGVRASAGPVAVPSSHPAATLTGSSALVAFTTARYPDPPLVVSGSGAGGAVTAAAVLADVLKATGH